MPVAIHADEGTSVKKKALMVLQFQPLLGLGSRKNKAGDGVPGINLLGNSLKTRFLFSVMLARVYGGKRGNRPLMKLVHHLACQLRDSFYHGCDVGIDGVRQKIFLVTLGCKGDWPALAKLGNLVRHHGRVTSTAAFGKGICHLCAGGTEQHPHWHDTSFANMMAMRENVPAPWNTEPDLTKEIPMEISAKAKFFKVDIFHTCHKGLMADLGANIIEPCHVYQLFLAGPQCVRNFNHVTAKMCLFAVHSS